jgi:ABC-2 type transport system permease protein
MTGGRRLNAAIASRHLRLHALNELQYRTNFFLQVLQSASQVAGALVSVGLIYGHVDELNGWTRPQLFAAIGVYTLLGGVMRAFIQPAMMRLMNDVQSGTFDFALTKPADAELLVSVRAVDVWQALDVIIGAVIVSIAITQLSGSIGPGDALAFAGLLVAGTVIIYCVWLSIAAATFWFVRVDFVDALYVGIFRAAQYPIGIYPAWLRVSLTVVIPLGVAVTAPSAAITSRLDAATLVVAAGVALLSLLISRIVWRRGVRRYSGASA